MSIQYGDTGKVAYGSLKTINTILATPRENLIADIWKANTNYSTNQVVYPITGNGFTYQCTTPGKSGSSAPTWSNAASSGSTISDGTVVWTAQTSTIGLPASNPGSASAQVSYTIQISDLPSITPNPVSVVYTPIILVAGYNTDAATQTVNFQIYKNGTSITTGSGSVTTGQAWTYNLMSFYNIAAGDILTASFWATSSNVTLDYQCLQVYPTRMIPGNSKINTNVSFSTNIPSFPIGSSVGGVPIVSGTLSVFPTNASGVSFSPTNNTPYPAMSWNSTYGCGQLFGGDGYQNCHLNVYSSRPYFYRNNFLSQLTFRELLH